MGILYSLTFPNGKKYIGITSKSLRRRLVTHASHARCGRDYCLQRAIRKYGIERVVAETLVVASDWDYLCDLEKRAVNSFATLSPGGYNISAGGEGVTGIKKSPEQRAAMSERGKGKNKGNKFSLGYRHTAEAIKKISEAGRRRVLSAESRAKIGASKIGNKNCVGRRYTAEQRRKLSESVKAALATKRARNG